MSESSYNKHPLKRLYGYSTDHRKEIYIAFIYSILNKILDLAPPVLIGAAIDVVDRREKSIIASLGFPNIRDQFIVLGILTLLIWGLESLFQYLYSIVWRNLAQSIEHRMRMDAYRHMQNLELEFFEDRKTGGLMSILNDDVNQLERFLDTGANDIIQVTTTVIIIGYLFFVLSPTTAWMAILPMPFILLFSFKFQSFLAPKYTEVREKVGMLNGQLSNNLSGIATIKSYTTEEFEAQRIYDLSKNYQISNRNAIKYSSAFSPLVRMIIVIGFTAMLIFAGIEAIDGKIEVGAYGVMLFLTQRLLWPLTRLGETFDQYQRAMASTTRILNLLDTPQQITSGNSLLELQNIKGEFIFNNVSFSYKNRLPVFTEFNLTINHGDTIAIVGATGAGKSTLIKLLLRFYDPDDGAILFDGISIRNFNLQQYRSTIGFVSQDTFLIDGSVRENIAYGRPNDELKDIIKAATIAEAHEFISLLPDGYDTLVGERGQKLSGGQRQRISIARAVLKNPPVLIFDEATSDVDNETEAAIQRSLDRIIVGRTTIIIAHRLSTIRNADQIYLLNNGQIIEQGTHDELLQQKGQYNKLWRVQTGERN
ncbi:MAG: ABC transporter ATP-binding protein/permease [Candidatus Heimdallarchaeota archaeon]|nr:ABC transporter ATP-binding protein/permease [Candidatus Heimdallarchaeota archaeon]MDH5646455.1 ABC transporter ATP-binding protein/permease [Candidatus Heimdallarchaeota archaeon]